MRRLRWGLRTYVTIGFAAGALLVSAALVIGTYAVSRHYLVAQRERTALRQAYSDAALVRRGLRPPEVNVADVLGGVAAPGTTTIFLRRGDSWYSSALTPEGHAVTQQVAAAVADGSVALAWTASTKPPSVVVGIPLASVGAEYYEVTVAEELHNTLRTLLTTLLASGAVATLGGAALGRFASHAVLRPLRDVTVAAARISGGDLDARLGDTDDPDLATLVGSFNNMADAVEERIQHDARFAADVSHELRTPLATLTTSLSVIKGAPGLPDRSQQAVRLMSAELDRFAEALEDLIALGRLDAGVRESELASTDIAELVRAVVAESGRPVGLVDAAELTGPAYVVVDRRQVQRALVNLFENADTHGGGLTAVRVRRGDAAVAVHVEDQGPGVDPADRERIFERFARAGARGSASGTGLGLSIVERTATLHGGSVWCRPIPGGTEFVFSLPVEGEAS